MLVGNLQKKWFSAEKIFFDVIDLAFIFIRQSRSLRRILRMKKLP